MVFQIGNIPVNSFKKGHKPSNGFKKGNKPHNKGKKGFCPQSSRFEGHKHTEEAKVKMLEASTKHGFCRVGKTHPIYRAWWNMKNRCYNPKYRNFEYWGGRGIVVCDRWKDSFENFVEDMLPSWGKGLSLDRYPNNDGNYESTNCRWATRKEQADNKRNNIIPN